MLPVTAAGSHCVKRQAGQWETFVVFEDIPEQDHHPIAIGFWTNNPVKGQMSGLELAFVAFWTTCMARLMILTFGEGGAKQSKQATAGSTVTCRVRIRKKKIKKGKTKN